jgi:hypothetical protein
MTHSLSVRGSVLLALLFFAVPPAAAAVLSVKDYPTPQAALDAAHDGDRIYFPSGSYLIPDSGLVVDKQLELYGDGIGRGDSGTQLKPRAANGDGNVIVIRSRDAQAPGCVTIRDLKITNNGAPGKPGEGRGYGILLQQGANSRGTVARLILERLVISAMAADGIRIEGADMGANAVILSTITDVMCVECRGNGMVLKNGVVISVERGYYIGNRLAGINAESVASLMLEHVAFEKNQARASVEAADYDPQLRLKLCHGFNMLGCYFERFATAAAGSATTAVTLETCRGGVLQGCSFIQDDYVARSRGILATGGASSITFGANTYDRVGTTLQLEDTESAQSHVVFPQCAVRAVPGDSTAYALRVGRRATGNIFMLPRASATDSTQRYYDGARWRSMTAGH